MQRSERKMFRIRGSAITEVLKNSQFNTKEKLAPLRNKPVVVVSIIGSSEYFENVGKGACKRAFQLVLDAFGSPYIFHETKFPKAQYSEAEEGGEHETAPRREMGCIDGFYTEDEKILFLHLEGAQDPCALLEEWHKVTNNLSAKELGFNEIWGRIKTKYCRSLLLLFSLSHVVLVSSNGNYFDTNYIQLFRVLDSVRLEVLPFVWKILGKIDGVNKSWKDHGRICSPRILFLFKINTNRPKCASEELPVSNPAKDEQFKLEEEIYHILRKCRIVTNISANSLFAIPTTQEYVFIFDEGVQEPEMHEDMLHRMSQLTIRFCEKMCDALLDPDQGDYKNASKLSFASFFPSIHTTNASNSVDQKLKTYNDVIDDFREFITAHSRLAHCTGFDDDSRRVAEHKHFFVLPNFGPWIKAFKALHNFFVLENHTDPQAINALSLMYKLNTVEVEYLESQCAKILPKMYSLYLKNLPEIYSEKLHKAKVNHVVEIFLKAANGPEVRSWIEELVSKCDRYWKAGRQQCEARSLQEHTCCHANHRVSVSDHLEVIPMMELDEDLPEKPHYTGQRLLSYCNCGHKQGTRDEPFTIREANYDFYDRMKHGCCDDLEKIEFPAFILPPGKEMIHPQEMLVVYQQKLVEFINNLGKYDAPSQDLEDELRQDLSLEFESEDSDVEAVPDTPDIAKKENFPQDLPTKDVSLNPIPERSEVDARKPKSMAAAVYSDFLPRSEQENEIIYKQIRERKDATSDIPETVTRIPQPDKVLLPDLEYQKSVRQMMQSLKQEIKEGEKRRRELCKSESAGEKPTESLNARSVKESLVNNFDSPLKLMALEMKKEEDWPSVSKHLPSHIVEWVENYSKSRDVQVATLTNNTLERAVELIHFDRLVLDSPKVIFEDPQPPIVADTIFDSEETPATVYSYQSWSNQTAPGDSLPKNSWKQINIEVDSHTAAVSDGCQDDYNSALGYSVSISESITGPEDTNSTVEYSSAWPRTTSGIQPEETRAAKPSEIVISVKESKSGDQIQKEVNPVRAFKHTDRSLFYLPGMLHSRSLPGLLPLYSSWSLVCAGSSSLYTHTIGITHQPGFLNGSSTLLPWDKMVKAEAGVSKPIPRLIRGRKPSGRARRITDEFSVKVFIGIEYECKRGHRFLLENANKILYINSHHGPPNLKEAARTIVDSDMPLYFRCPCKDGRDSQPVIAQLMRLHVITPKAPVHVTLNPKVQPAPSPCPVFYPGIIEPVKLTPSSYWILRLPYCYVGDDQVYVPSKDVARYNGKLLKGVYDVESMSQDETLVWESEQGGTA